MLDLVVQLPGFLLDLRTTDVGMPCEDYEFILIMASEEIPPRVRDLMSQHTAACAYHTSREFYQGAIGVYVEPHQSEAANQMVRKYNQED